VKKRIGLGTWSWGNKFFWNYQSTNDDDLRETYMKRYEEVLILLILQILTVLGIFRAEVNY